MLSQFECLLFNVLILKALGSGDGRIWRWISSQLIVIEITCKNIAYEGSEHLAVSHNYDKIIM